MKLGIRVKLTITDAGALRNEGWVETERPTSENEAISILFAGPRDGKSFKVLAVDVQGSGTERIVRIVADVRNKEKLVQDANDMIAYEMLCQDPVTTPFSAFRELIVAKNNYTSRAQIGVSFDDGVQMNNTDIRRVLERAADSHLSR